MRDRYRGVLCVLALAGMLLMPPPEVAFGRQGELRPKREFRGAWIATVTNLDWPSSRSLTPTQQRNELVAILDALAATGINAVIFQVRPECDALYISPYEPWSYWLTGVQGTGPSPVYDPLEFAVSEAHKRGMELHAWFNPFRAYRETNTYPTHSTHVTKTHPEWILTCPDGYKIMDPGLPHVRDHIAMIIADVVRRYDIDGVHMDDYFYPYPEHNFTVQDTASFRVYSRGYPDSLKGDWRRGNVNILVQQMYDSVQAIKPWVKVGMSPFGIWKSGVPSGIFGMDAYSVIYCDAIAWLQNRSIDYLTPQLYWAFGGGQDYGKLQPWWADSAAANGRHLYTGNAPYSLSGAEIERQLEFNRANPKVQGSVHFRAKSIVNNTNGIRDRLTQDVNRHGSAIPVMGWKETVPPNAPTSLQAQLNGGTGLYELAWTAPAAASDGDTARRFLVYRFPMATPGGPDFDQGKNVMAVVGGTLAVPPSKVDTTGVTYAFAVSALDKNNNESAATSVITIPVAAPASPVLAYPLDGEQNYTKGATLRWLTSAGARTYRVQLATASTFDPATILLETDSPDTVEGVPTLLPQTTYSWRVAAGNQGGASAYSPTASFGTGWPLSPVAVTPIGNNFPRDPVFAWRSRGGTSYRVRVVDYASQVTMIDTTVSDTTFRTRTPLPALLIYQWYIQAQSPYGASDWSTEVRFRTSSITFAEDIPGVPSDYHLSQNYPNPFNAATTIRFEIPLPGFTTLTVHDILGRQVELLVNEELPAGRYTVNFDARHLASGTYIAVLTSGGSRISQKMILLK